MEADMNGRHRETERDLANPGEIAKIGSARQCSSQAPQAAAISRHGCPIVSASTQDNVSMHTRPARQRGTNEDRHAFANSRLRAGSHSPSLARRAGVPSIVVGDCTPSIATHVTRTVPATNRRPTGGG